MKPLDAIDRKILSVLQDNGRISNAALSAAVHLSPTPCLERVRRLEREGYIKAYHADLCPAELECDFITFVAVNLRNTSDEAFQSFSRAVASFDEVVSCHMIGGKYDYLMKVRTKDMQDYRHFMAQKLSRVPELASTQSYFAMEEVKCTHALPVIKSQADDEKSNSRVLSISA